MITFTAVVGLIVVAALFARAEPNATATLTTTRSANSTVAPPAMPTTAPVCNMSAPAFNVTAALESNSSDPLLNFNACNTTAAPNATIPDDSVPVVDLSPSEVAAQSLYRIMCVVSTVSFVGARGTPMSVLLDAQLVGLLSLSDCASPTHRQVLAAGSFLALPGAAGTYDASSMLYGALMTLIAIVVLQGLAWVVAMQMMGISSWRDPGPLEAAYVPAILFGGFILSASGLAYAGVAALADPDRDLIQAALGVASVLGTLAGVLAFNLFRRMAFEAGYYRHYTFIKRWGELPRDADRHVQEALRYYPLAFPALVRFRRMSPWLFEAITPDGTWFPNEFLKRFAPCVDALTNAPGPTRIVTGVQMARVTLTAALSAIPAQSGPECATKHGVVALIHGLTAVALFVFWSNPRVPQRQPLLVMSSVGTMFASVGLAHPLVYHFVPPAVLWLCAVWCVAAIVDVAVLWFEWTILGPTEEGIRDSHRFTLRRRRRMKLRPEKPPPPKPPTPPPPESVDPEDAESRSNLSSVGFIESRRQGPLVFEDFPRPIDNPLGPRPVRPEYEAEMELRNTVDLGRQRLRFLVEQAAASTAVRTLHRRRAPQVEVIRRRQHGDPLGSGDDWSDL